MTIQAFSVDRKEIQAARRSGESYESAVSRLARPVQVGEDHPAYNSLVNDMPAVIGGVLYDLTVERLMS